MSDLRASTVCFLNLWLEASVVIGVFNYFVEVKSRMCVLILPSDNIYRNTCKDPDQ